MMSLVGSLRTPESTQPTPTFTVSSKARERLNVVRFTSLAYLSTLVFTSASCTSSSARGSTLQSTRARRSVPMSQSHITATSLNTRGTWPRSSSVAASAGSHWSPS